MKKIIYFIVGELLTLILYLIFIGIYTRISSDPIIFFASIVLGLLVVALTVGLIKIISKELFEKFSLFLMALVYFFSIITFSVFGPTFIDRSISYHLLFLVVEEKHITMNDMENSFSKAVFNKRMHDALATGFVEENDKGELEPTLKSKIIYNVLKPLGKITNSLDDYNEMKKSISSDLKKETKESTLDDFEESE